MTAIATRSGAQLLSPPRLNWQGGDGLYALAMIDLDKVIGGGTGLPIESALSGAQPSEFLFAFPMNPQRIDAPNPPAVNVTLLQSGGVHIEDDGVRVRPITIEGTTGLRPSAVPKSTIPVLGLQLPSFLQPTPSELTGLHQSEQTGFDYFLALSNFFARYYEARKDPDTRRRVRMVFHDGHLGEFWIVVPVGNGLTPIRDRSSPLTIPYRIELLGIARLDFVVKPATRITAGATGFLGVLARIAEVTNTIREAFDFASAVVSRTAGLALGTINTILGPVNAIIEGLRNLTTSTREFLTIPRTILRTTVNNIRDLWLAVDGFINTAVSANPFDQLPSIDPFHVDGTLTDRAKLSSALKNMYTALNVLDREETLWSAPAASVATRRAALYGREGTARAGGEPALQPAAGAAQDRVQSNETIRQAARRLLGDPARWEELVQLNNLRPPYISPAGDGRSVLRPGDRILYPSNRLGPATGAAGDAEDRFEALLGRDIRLERVDGGKYDWAVEDGDLDTIAGTPNYAQAIEIKLQTPRGRMQNHVGFGNPARAVKKVSRLRSLIEMQVGLQATVLADERTHHVEGMRLRLRSNALFIFGAAFHVAGGESLALNTSVRR